MEKTQTRPWDPAEHLETDEDVAAYLNVALEEGDLSLIMATLGDIARARRMATVAEEAGLGRESLYKSLSANGNPEFATVLKVVRALGLQLRAAAPGDRPAERTTHLESAGRRRCQTRPVLGHEGPAHHQGGASRQAGRQPVRPAQSDQPRPPLPRQPGSESTQSGRPATKGRGHRRLRERPLM